jgi:hypothetical protein
LVVKFARGGFQISDPQQVPKELGWFGEIMYVYTHAYKQAAKDIKKRNYFTVDVLLTTMPLFFIFILLLICLLPNPEPPKMAESRPRPIPNAATASGNSSSNASAAPPTSSIDSSKKSD